MSRSPSAIMYVHLSDTRFEVRLNRIAREMGLTRADVFRRAIALYKASKQEEKNQGQVILRGKDGSERELVNFWLI